MPRARAIDQPGFPRLWLGQSVSLLGSQVTLVALPLTAVLALGAGPTQMGALRVASTAPFLVFGLLAGAWVDRRSRLNVLTASSLGQALLLATIPALALAGGLRIEILYVVAFLVGFLTVLFDVAYQAFLPSLVRTESLVDANSKLETSRSLSQVIGPSAGGILVQLVTAPVAILADVVSFIVSAAALRTIPDPERRSPPEERASLLREVWEGMTALLGHPVLRSIATAATLVGVALAVNGLGGVLGAVGSGSLSGRLPVALGLGLGLVTSSAGILLMASATGPLVLILTLLLAGEAVVGFGVPFFNVNQLSLRQSITPARLQARVHATSRTLTWGAVPFGALAGGLLGEHIGLRSTLVVSGAATLATALIAYAGLLQATRSRPPDTPS